MSDRPRKHSLTLKGHRTSVSLEDDFWRGFRRIAAARGRPLNDLAAEIDAARDPETGLATAIRLYVFRALCDPDRTGAPPQTPEYFGHEKERP